LKSRLFCCLMIAVLILSATMSVYAADSIAVISVPKVMQSQTNWCWAACGESILRYFNKSVTQTSFANLIVGGRNCGASDQDVQTGLANWNVNGTLVQNYISFSTARSNIRAGRPIYAGWTWHDVPVGATVNGHAIVIRGTDGTSASSGYISYMDPGDGQYHTLTYAEFKGGSSSSYDHIWDGTIYSLQVG